MGPRKESGEVACGLMPELEGTDCWPWMKGEGPKVEQRVPRCPQPSGNGGPGEGVLRDPSTDEGRRLREFKELAQGHSAREKHLVYLR